MNLRIILIFFLLTLSGIPVSVKAAFPVKQVAVVPPVSTDNKLQQFSEGSEGIKEAFGTIMQPAEEKAVSDAQGGGELGLVSFGLGIIAMLSVIAAMAAALPGLLAVGILAAIAAIVTGAMSFNKKNKGFAIAGFVLGIIEVIPLVLTVLVLSMAPYKSE